MAHLDKHPAGLRRLGPCLVGLPLCAWDLLTLPVGALSGAVRGFAGPVGRVGLDVEGVSGGGLQVPDDVLQSHLTDGLFVFLLHRI